MKQAEYRIYVDTTISTLILQVDEDSVEVTDCLDWQEERVNVYSREQLDEVIVGLKTVIKKHPSMIHEVSVSKYEGLVPAVPIYEGGEWKEYNE